MKSSFAPEFLKSTGARQRRSYSATPDSHQQRRPGRASANATVFRVIVVEDHLLVREFIAERLSRGKSCKIVAAVGSAEEALSASQRLCPDLLILDINLPAQSGTEILPSLRRLCPKTRVLVCSGSVDDKQIVAILRAGPHGFIEKNCSTREFLEAVVKVASGQSHYCHRSSRLLAEMAQGIHMPTTKEQNLGKRQRNGRVSLSARVEGLTPQECRVLSFIADGKTSKEIAAVLNLSEGTIITHRANLMRKLKLRNASQLTRFAINQGL